MRMFRSLFLFLSFFICIPLFSAYSNKKGNGIVKCRSSYYTEERVRNAAENIQKYTWARKEKDEAVACAERWLADFNGDYARIWDMMPSQKIPRSFAVNSLKGCLVCGTEINKYGNYSYLYDKHKIDWKLTCPNCHLTFPTNDFKSYYEGGLDSDGRFDPEKARRHNDALLRKGERGNLVNMYAVKGLTADQLKDLKAAGASDSIIHRITNDLNWGVDDGMGYHFNPSDKEKYGDPYTYVAYYAHWVIWYWRVMPMLDDLSRAYMFTRYSTDPKERDRAQTYADAAIVMLDRIADLYPEMYVSPFPRHNYFGFPNCGNVWGTYLSSGRIIGSIWENTFIKSVMFAYDAVFPGIKTLSANAKGVLVRKSGQVNKGNSECIKNNFENGVLREVAKAFRDGNLQGNPGMQQSTLALAAVVIDHNPETQRWLDIVFKNGNSDWHSKGERDGGSTMRYLVDRISRDGQGDEVSLGYNAGWLENWIAVARMLDGYHIPDGGKLSGNIDPDLYHNPRFERLFYVNPILLTDDFTPHIGDTGATGDPDHFITNINNLILGYSKYKTTELAQKIYLLKNKTLANIHMDIFTKDPENIKSEIQKEIKNHGEFLQSSENQSAYGLAILRDGLPPENTLKTTQRTLWMFYGTRNASHNHADPLNIGYIGYDLDLMPDFGYPNTLGGELNPEQQWDKSTPAHNTVSFNALGYRGHIVGYGKPLHYDVTKSIQLIHATSNEVENSYKLYARDYERTTALVRINNSDSYIVDFFHVNSTYPYTYNFHTGEIDPASTLYHNITFDPATPAVTYNKNTFRNVRTAFVHDKLFSIDWNLVDTWNQYKRGVRAKTNIHLKITMPGYNKKIQLGEAIPPTNNGSNPAWVPLLRVPGHGMTTFVSVIEPYELNSKIASIEILPVWNGKEKADSTVVKAVRVRLKNGRTDYLINSFDRNTTYRIANKFKFRGFFCLYSENENGRVIRKYINDGTLLDDKTYLDRITGRIVDATKELSDTNYIIIRTDERINPKILKGKYIYVDNSDISDSKGDDALLKYNAVYPIISAVKQSKNMYKLNLGSCSVIKGFADLNDYNKGYLRDFNIGSDFYIPLSFLEEYNR
ncbi:MAG: heparinase II/III-family protein [Prevotella sp.]|nr:heparinase II/III-family protein [Prevotella sp.]